MATVSDDEVVVSDGKVRGRERFDHWIVDHLAKYPGRVTLVTFFAGLAATGLVSWLSGDDTLVTVISLLATLWALFFSVMIYLLSARDTDRVLEQISDLQEQLGTALASPDETEGEDAADGATAQDQPLIDNDHSALSQQLSRPQAPGRVKGAETGDRFHIPRSAKLQPHLVRGVAEIQRDVPPALLTAWKTATGGDLSMLSRAWTPDYATNRQWVFQTDDHHRWVVFSRENGGVGVLPLDSDGRRGAVRWFPSR